MCSTKKAAQPLQSRVVTAAVTCAQGLTLDVLLPPGVGTLLPNLNLLAVEGCLLTPAAMTTVLDTACGNLRTVFVDGLAGRVAAAAAGESNTLQQLATAQLRQLASLPSLDRIVLRHSSCPTLFLMALGTQLTHLDLDKSYRQRERGTEAPVPGWTATLQHVARCTRLQELCIPLATAGELRLVAPALEHVRRLVLNSGDAATDGDAVMEVLLGLPHLTALEMHDCTWTLRSGYTSRPCRWEELTLGRVGVHQLARLPLRSLTQPLRWGCLLVHKDTPLLDARAAVANLMGRCPAGFQWGRDGKQQQLLVPREADNAILRELRPLFAPLVTIDVACVDMWDVARVKALGEVLPRTLTHLSVSWGTMPREVIEQLACSLPWVQHLQSTEQVVSPEDVVAYVRLARRLKQAGGEGGEGDVSLKKVVVERPERRKGMGENRHKREWEQAIRAVREEGGDVTLGVEW